MKYFTDCNSVEELKKTYFRLAMKNHPDKGGDSETMKVINAEYDKAFELLKDIHTSLKEEGERYYQAKTPTTEAPEDFKTIIDFLLKMTGIEVELCGRWIWISGNTKEHKETLKTIGCKWAAKKKQWSWHYPEDRIIGYKGRKCWDMNKIRDTFGSQAFDRAAEQNLIGAN